MYQNNLRLYDWALQMNTTFKQLITDDNHKPLNTL
jgi:hypothetical protein